MPDPDFGKITDEKVAQLKARIGLTVDPDNYLPLDPEVVKSWKPKSTGYNHEVTADGVRHFVHGHGDDNPLYCDPEYAQTTRWGTLIGSPTFSQTMSGTLDPQRQLKPEIAAKLKGDPLRGVGDLQSELHYEFYRPLRLGDRVYTEGAAIGVQDKRSSWGGRAVHNFSARVAQNRDREVTHHTRVRMIRAERRPASEVMEQQAPPDPYTPEQLAEIDAAYAAETRRGDKPRYWEDVEVGEELPVMVKGPLRVTEIILYHGGFGQGFPTFAHKLAYQTRMRTPGLYSPNELNIPDIVQRMHWEKDWALKVGASERYDYGAIRESFLANLVTAWQGDDGWLWKLNIQHRRFNFIGSTNWLKGRVIGKEQTDVGSEVHLEIWIEDQRGVVISPGSAVVLLPSRAKGPVVLPPPIGGNPTELFQNLIKSFAEKGSF